MRQIGSDLLLTGSGAATGANSVRLRTLTHLRWLAIAGQLVTITVASRVLGIQLPIGLCYLAVGASIVVNLLAVFLAPENKRLTEAQALAMLLFDVAQLCALIGVTGGLTNPFSLLVLAPVTISASTLGLRSTLLLGVSTVVLITAAALTPLPLVLRPGEVLAVPPIVETGFWFALVVGIVFLGIYSRRVATETRAMSDALLATQMALAREQKLTDLGGVVAAAAHELGTPLATIKLVSSELMSELGDQPELLEDARLIRDQADRCRDILRGMGRAGKDDLHLHQAPFETLLREAAEPHLARGKDVVFTLSAGPGGAPRQPAVLRRPEIIHGLRNLVQNAVDFARSTVWVDGEWTGRSLLVRIVDDGAGYPPQVIGRIGDPFVRARRADPDQRPGYEGMGLGLFIAKTLLERTGATLTFTNAADPFLTPDERPDRCGAVVEAVWPLSDIVAPRDMAAAPNRPIKA